MHRTNYLLALAAAGSLATTVAPVTTDHLSDPQTGQISGRVTTRLGTPLPAAHIDVTDHDAGVAIATLTSVDGRYVVSGLSIGHAYDVLIRSIGYAPLRRSVFLSNTEADGANAEPVVDAVLLPIDRPPPTAASTAMRGS
jgi:hypothetical protein